MNTISIRSLFPFWESSLCGGSQKAKGSCSPEKKEGKNYINQHPSTFVLLS